jgi:hypothetical protein
VIGPRGRWRWRCLPPPLTTVYWRCKPSRVDLGELRAPASAQEVDVATVVEVEFGFLAGVDRDREGGFNVLESRTANEEA